MDEDILIEEYTFESIMERLLEHIPAGVDTREGSVIYNALAPAAWELQLLYSELSYAMDEVFADTAGLDHLIRRAAERGIDYKDATHAVVRGEFEPKTINVLGGRFTESVTGLSYIAIEKAEDGIYRLECETEGTAGNLYEGQLVTDESFDDDELLTSAKIMGLVTPAEDAEDEESFRTRYFESVSSKQFGGNIADYRAKALEQTKVGAVKVYPVWNGGGTVKLVILSAAKTVPDSSTVQEIQTLFDPEQNHGEGLGLAPIGHSVTVKAAEEVKVNLTLTVTYSAENSNETASGPVRQIVEQYLQDLRNTWGEANDDVCTVKKAQIISAILNCEKIDDVTAVLINGADSNLTLNSEQIPVMGDITYAD